MKEIIIELIAITLIWIAIGYKREVEIKLFHKHWFVQLALVVVAVVMLKAL
jgi:hypothetical protein